jgi:hypothetical protein
LSVAALEQHELALSHFNVFEFENKGLVVRQQSVTRFSENHQNSVITPHDHWIEIAFSRPGWGDFQCRLPNALPPALPLWYSPRMPSHTAQGTSPV